MDQVLARPLTTGERPITVVEVEKSGHVSSAYATATPIEPAVEPSEFAPLPLGNLSIWPPVVLAPMAGVTNPPFRTLCQRSGSGLFVSEMITARGLVENNEKTLKLAEFGAEEALRSSQLYGTNPTDVGRAVAKLVNETGIDHVDLNFGCPAKKITRKGGGAAVPVKPRLLADIVRAAVENAGAVPVTMKFRTGINDEIQTFLDAGRIGRDEGCAAIALHGRTAAQLYSGHADWSKIAELKAEVSGIPVLGNGDIWEASDAIRMMRETGCDGVVIGRGCLGRPWLFGDLERAFEGLNPTDPPTLGMVVEQMRVHAALMIEWLGERKAMVDFRKHASWYTKGYPLGPDLRSRMVEGSTLAELDAVLDELDPNGRLAVGAMRIARAKRGGRAQKVALPDGYLDDLTDAAPPCDADDLNPISGG